MLLVPKVSYFVSCDCQTKTIITNIQTFCMEFRNSDVIKVLISEKDKFLISEKDIVCSWVVPGCSGLFRVVLDDSAFYKRRWLEGTMLDDFCYDVEQRWPSLPGGLLYLCICYVYTSEVYRRCWRKSVVASFNYIANFTQY